MKLAVAFLVLAAVVCCQGVGEWCMKHADRIRATCHIKDASQCKSADPKYAGYTQYVKNGGECGICDGCIKEVGAGEDCVGQYRGVGFYPKCKKGLVCEWPTFKCVSGSA